MACTHPGKHKQKYAAPQGWSFRAFQCPKCGGWEIITPPRASFADSSVTLTPETVTALKQSFRDNPYRRDKVLKAGIPRQRLDLLMSRQATPTIEERAILGAIAQLEVVAS